MIFRKKEGVVDRKDFKVCVLENFYMYVLCDKCVKILGGVR
jgi:hypothetical protein